MARPSLLEALREAWLRRRIQSLAADIDALDEQIVKDVLLREAWSEDLARMRRRLALQRPRLDALRTARPRLARLVAGAAAAASITVSAFWQ